MNSDDLWRRLDEQRESTYRAGLEILKEQALVWIAPEESGLRTEVLCKVKPRKLHFVLMLRLNAQIITNRLNDRIVWILSGIHQKGMISREALLSILDDMTLIVSKLPTCDDLIEVEAIRSKRLYYDVVVNTKLRRVIQHSHTAAEIPEMLAKQLERKDLEWRPLADI